MHARSLYDVLQVSPSAQPAVIEAAYRALMKRHHPDQADDPAQAALASTLNDAYAVLKSPERRADYDQRLELERRERAQQAQARLAAIPTGPPPPERGLNWFGWSGWLVALIICGVLVTIPRPARLSNSSPQSAVASPGPDLVASRKTQPDPSTLAQAGAELGVSIPIVPVAALPQKTTPEPVFSQIAPPPATGRSTASRRTATTTNRVRQRRTNRLNRENRQPSRPAPARNERDAEFLEREGLIY